MTYFAKLDADNIVIFVTAGRLEDDGLEEELNSRTGDVYRQTYIDGSARFNYAGLGHTYDENRDAFISPQPYASWVLDEDTCLWQPPLPYPEDGGNYRWDEDLFSWELDQ